MYQHPKCVLTPMSILCTLDFYANAPSPTFTATSHKCDQIEVIDCYKLDHSVTAIIKLLFILLFHKPVPNYFEGASVHFIVNKTL